MTVTFQHSTNEFVQQYIENGGSSEQAMEVLSHLLELSVVMYQKGDIKTVNHQDKIELVCQLKKGSRRIALGRK